MIENFPNAFYRANVILIPKTDNDIIKTKLQTNIFDEHKQKTPQENINKPNLTIYSKDHTP